MINGTTNNLQNPAELLRPSLWFKSITFSDETVLEFEEDDIVVFVGPNNAGKSATLRELETWIASSRPGVVLKSAQLQQIGTTADFTAYLKANAQILTNLNDSSKVSYVGSGYQIHESNVVHFDMPQHRGSIAPFFTKRLATENRIQGANPAPALALYRQPPTHPIHFLMMDQEIAADISQKFRHAFGQDLTVFRAGGGNYPLYVGQKPALEAGKDELSKEFVKALLATNVPLEEQGDGMRSFAAVILHVLAAKAHSVQFLDEPEAFLHPPQARLLGGYIAANRQDKSQLFIATHSTDVLDGLIEGGAGKVRIVRIRRDGVKNKVVELGKEKTMEVARDTLTRFSRVFDGIFFEHVVICESDADCMFYQSILNLRSISGNQRPDVLFVHTAGKHRMVKLADTLRALDVPCSVIADIDVLSEESTFKQLFETLGGDWIDVRPHWKALADAVKAQRPPLNASQVSNMISNAIVGVSGTQEFPRDKERDIKQIFKVVSPWSALKQSGRSAVPAGEAITHFDKLSEKSAALGLWIIQVGEIEGFCRSMGSHGPGFVEKVLEERNIEHDEELAAARDFVAKVWQRAKPIN